MTHRPRPAAPASRPPALGVHATVVRAHDAPGPTLVLRLDHLPPGALALGGELAWVRRALVGTPYARIGKIALYRPGPTLDYRFVQALPTGGFDFRAGCGHSLLACVVADGRPGPVTVRAVTTGDTVLCEPQPHGDAYTLSFLRAPTAPGTLPTGRPVDLLDGTPVSVVRYGNPYVFVDARHLRAHGDLDARHLRAHGDLDARHLRAQDDLDRLLSLRAHAARLLGHPPHSALPKIATFTRGPAGISVRALTVGGWHPRLALTGAAALAAAGALDGTVVPTVSGPVRTPGGTVTVSTAPDRVRVHHKRAEVLERLELPWRIHATA
ncbi:PrpF domain-containing protein [Streptomyces sp. NPDC093795]|uniref:PrpF domain-containing protein n=1 Tax=Streptomyces sp. NPDC093795 TaxID=3366051 RepID=UPI00382DC741